MCSMKHIAFIKQTFIFLVGALVVLLTGCIKEDLGECNRLTLKVVNADNNDITPLGNVSKASLYIFDENKTLLEKRILDMDFIINRKTIELDYPVGKKLTLVAWGNLGDQNQMVTNVKTLEELSVMLKSQNSLAQSPDSLFYGNKQVITSELGVAGGNQEIVIVPKIGSITVETQGLDFALKHYGLKSLKSANEFNFYMNRTKSGFDYNGTIIGDSVYYNPEGALVSNEWKTKKNNNTCTGENLSFSIEVNGQELGTVDRFENKNGETGPLAVNAYENTHVVIQFGEDGTVSARMKITPWGTVDDDIDF